jgi:PAS domain S-box-containing protein
VQDRKTDQRLVQSITRNITERKTAELKSERDQKFMQSLADSFPGILYVFDLETRKISYLNSEVEKILGYTAEELLDTGDRFLETVLTAQDYYNFLNRDVTKYLNAELGEVIEWNYQAKTKDGHLRWMHNRDIVISTNENGHPKEIIGTALDVTEQRHREQEVRQKSLALEQIYDAVLIMSNHGEVQYMNTAAERIFGLSMEDVRGKNIRELSQQLIIGEAGWGGILNALKEQGYWKGEHQVKTIGGQRTFEAVSSPLINENELVTGILTVMRDISDRKNAESELFRSVERQEVLLKELHHRVKNNLQIMSSLLGMQRNNVQAEELAVILDEAEERIMTMALIHEQLYSSEDFSQVSLGNYLDSLINRSRKTLLESIENLKIDIEAEEVFITLDRAIPIGLILNELISNTAKYAFNGDIDSPQIRIKLAANNNHFEVHFSDNGVGFPAGFNLESSTSLGHFLIQTLATQLEADVDIRSDGGVHFSIRIPH